MAKKTPKKTPNPARPAPVFSASGAECANHHFRIGWWSLLLFLSLGILLEALHGFKLGWFLDVGMETRRLMWRLAHAHGTLLSVLHIAFGGMAVWIGDWRPVRRTIASHCLSMAAVLMPAGFFLGGLYIYEGDPGLGIMLVPVGAVLLFVSVLMTAISVPSNAVPSSKVPSSKVPSSKRPSSKVPSSKRPSVEGETGSRDRD